MNDNALWIILQRLRTPLLVLLVSYAISILGLVLIPGMDDKGEVYQMSFFDAFYFISYTASTIGFGETPYAFTYEQRLWVIVCIYLTVLGWFYAIGSLVSIISDKKLRLEIMRGRFKTRIETIKGEFIIVLGYNYVNAKIIQKLLHADLNVVLVDAKEDKINEFLLEDYSKSVPVMVGNALTTHMLIDAGIKKKTCITVIATFYKEEKNLRIAILTKFLNPKAEVIAKSTFNEISTSISDTDIVHRENPFEIFGKRFDIALTSPHVLILENWIYHNADLSDNTIYLPKGKYIICGYGRLGRVLKEQLDKHEMEYVFIDEAKIAKRDMKEPKSLLRANADDKEVLLSAGIKEAVCLVSGTQSDIDNLSILITAKKLNPDLYLIARENTMEEVSIFEAAKINWIIMLERILINKTSLQLIDPLKHSFLKMILNQNELWASTLVNLLKNQLGANPILIALSISEKSAYAIYHEIQLGKNIPIEVLLTSLKDRSNKHKAIILLLKRQGKEILLPQNEFLKLGDEILFACDQEAKEEIELIASNLYDLCYAYLGEEKKNWLFKKIFSS
ncbi:MAG: Potassium channel protein [uncultured Sulfurovum sp.]|uniref:Potassium channel protein n=1 Tax=uncultured Sulfurovum sp. TaxID=269237 RepID=A0A6S6U4X9_9BACT|nr:MAG: Potassium channel protein [uncultured Sulfurovum sp.]